MNDYWFLSLTTMNIRLYILPKEILLVLLQDLNIAHIRNLCVKQVKVVLFATFQYLE